ncbi:MDR family MFS transporter [Actinacidiphila paucisporea]|uniref:Drug resistance transporter, EmrB/QacA subfamily n=1 Tax=Actinacidiphila paucisporea TaxID=310782 RepID=A0A1M6XM81_9ACTN|nr:drug resistance transporter, EmrB/QacA subfamily [Actinacidiphila paucisporea]
MAQDTSTAVAPGEHQDRRQVRIAIGALALGLLLAALDQTIVSTALPTIVSELGGIDHLSWVVTAYLLASTAATPLWGKLGDMYGRKRLFQTVIVIFLIGSALCGVAQSMGELITFRAIQGLGGGGLIALSMAIVGDIVPPRDRGRYQGVFGGVFGAASVLGPLLGGVFTEQLSWRWVFYINLPIGIVALAVIAAVLHIPVRRTSHRIDYLGMATVAAAATCLVLVTSLGGSTLAWGSPGIIALAVVGVALVAAFVLIERRVQEPVLPPRLFRVRTFVVCSVISFIIGFAMFGAMTYLPTFLQVVHGYSPTLSGVHMIPMVVGLLLASTGSGQIISRTGRYKIFPVVGTAITAVGLLLLHTLDEHTATWVLSVYFFIFGFGLGLVMQVLVLAVQNAVGYEDLGVATSGATFFRSIGASFGVSVFGTIFTNQLSDKLTNALRGVPVPPGFNAGQLQADPKAIAGLPAVIKTPVLHAYSQAITTVFLWAVPVAAVGFVTALLLREQPLRGSVTVPDASETVGVNPVERSSLDEIARCLSLLGSRDARRDLYTRITRLAGVDVQPATSWLLLRLAHDGRADPVELARRTTVPADVIESAAVEAESGGYAVREGNPLVLTASGSALADRLTESRRSVLSGLLGDWDPAAHSELAALVKKLSIELCAGDTDHPDRKPRGRPAVGEEAA